MGNYYVYIMTNNSNSTLYVGMTNNLLRRVGKHKSGHGSNFTSKYDIKKLVYFEQYPEAITAIAREKQIKAGSRKKKINLINSLNSQWEDLYEDL